MKAIKKENNSCAELWGIGLLAIMLMLGSTSFAQEKENLKNTDLGNAAEEYVEWDVNSDNQLDQDEFSSFINEKGLYESWDSNRDGAYDDDEVTTGFFSDADGDDDGYLNNNEYDKNLSILKRNYGDNTESINNFDTLDTNNDSSLDAEEYKAGNNDRELYRDWDTDNDGSYSKKEFNKGLFSTYDTNGDGFVDESEFNERRPDSKTNE